MTLFSIRSFTAGLEAACRGRRGAVPTPGRTWLRSPFLPLQILALVAVRKAMDYLFSQHDLSFLDDVIPEKDKKKKEDEKKKKKKKGSVDSDNDDVRGFLLSSHGSFLAR